MPPSSSSDLGKGLLGRHGPTVTILFVSLSAAQYNLESEWADASRKSSCDAARFEYFRCGAWAYMAALDVHHARVFGRCETQNKIAPFDRLGEQVMTRRLRVLRINGTENRVKVTRILQVLAGVPIPHATSSKASVGFRRGRRWPRATESGTENAYRPSKLMWSNTNGESRATSSGRTG